MGRAWWTAPSRAKPFWTTIVCAVRDKMVEVLNRRNYLRNLLRDIDEVLES